MTQTMDHPTMSIRIWQTVESEWERLGEDLRFPRWSHREEGTRMIGAVSRIACVDAKVLPDPVISD